MGFIYGRKLYFTASLARCHKTKVSIRKTDNLHPQMTIMSKVIL